MRFLVVMLVLCIALAAGARPIIVPGEHTYLDTLIVTVSPPGTTWVYVTQPINSIQDGVDLAIMLTYEHDLAGMTFPPYITTGFVDSVLVMPGVYDSVRAFDTPIGRREAIVSISNDIVLTGQNRSGVRIDHAQAEYGILCQNVSENTVISNLTILGGISRDMGRLDDGDGRLLAAGIICLDAASPTIRAVDIENGATGIVVRTEPASDDSAPVIERVVVARGSHHGIYVFDNGSQPVIVNRCTLVENFDYGVYVNGGLVEISNSALTNNGKNGVYGYLATPSVKYCNVYWNDRMFPDPDAGPLNYGGTLGDLTGIDGNISAEPFYCDFYGSAGYDYHVCLSNPVSPHHQAGEGGVTIGAYNAVCTACQSSPVEESSWGAIKAMYRR